MALRDKFRKRKNRRTQSGLNPAGILRPRKGQTRPSKSESQTKQEKTNSNIISETSAFAPPTVSLVPPNVVSTESSLPYLRNPYPDEVGIDPSSNYTREGGNIRLTGKYSENYLDFNDVDINGIESCEGTSFNFLVQFEDGTLHTSPLFLSELQSENSSANPYRNKNTVSVLTLDSNFLSGYGTQDIFDIPEQYAEVKVGDTLNSRKDILYHIDWLCSSGDTLKKANELGSWNVETTEELGFDHAEALDILNGEEPVKEGGTVGQSIGTSEEPVVTTDDSSDSLTTNTPVDDVYPPFGYRGVRRGEVKTWTDGNDYIWKKGRKRFGRRGSDNGRWVLIQDDTTTSNTNSPGPAPSGRPSGGSGRGRQRFL